MKRVKFERVDLFFFVLFALLLEIKFVNYFDPLKFLIVGGLTALIYFFLKKKNLLKEKFIQTSLRISIIILLALISFSFFKGGLLDEGIPTFSDFPHHYYVEYLISHKILPEFKNIVGWDHTFAGGYVQSCKQPPFQSILVFITSQIFPIPFSLIFRLIVILGFFFSVFSVYYFSKKIMPITSSLFVTLLWMSTNHNQFFTGGYAAYYGLGFSLLFFKFYLDFVEGKQKAVYPASLFALLAFNSHPFIFAFTAFFIVCYFFLSKDYKKIPLKSVLLPLTLFIMGTLLYFSDVILVDEIFKYKEREKAFSWYDFKNQFLSLIPLFPVAFMSSFYPVFFTGNKRVKYLSIILIFFIIVNLIFFSLVNRGLIPDLVAASKPLFFIQVFFIITGGYFISKVLKFKCRTFSSILILVFLSVLIYNLIFDSFFLNRIIQNPSSVWEKYYSWDFRKVYKMELTDGILSDQVRGDTKDIFEWINNSKTSGRIIFEDDWKTFKLGGGHEMSRAYFTGKKFVNMPFPFFLKGIDLEIERSKVFGVNVTDLNYRQIKPYLDYFNVEYFIAWSQPLKNFLESNENFEKVYSNGFYDVYRYKEFPDSYMFGAKGKVKFKDKEILVNVFNAKENDQIMISSRYFSRWHAYADEKEIEIYPVKNTFIGFNSPKSGTYTVIIRYQEGLMEKISKYLSLLSFLTLIGICFMGKIH
jgi:hypothetical protein